VPLSQTFSNKKAITRTATPYNELNCLNKIERANPGFKVLPHQKRFVEYILNYRYKNGALMFHSVGSGKTITAILSAKCLSEKFNKKVFIVTPASLVSNFEKQIKKLKIVFRQGIVISSYIKFLKSKHDCTDSFLVIDEAHNMNGGGVVYKGLLECSKKALKTILLTATPVRNAVDEMSIPLSFIFGKKISKKEVQNALYISNDIQRLENTKKAMKCSVSVFDKPDENVDYPTTETHDVNLIMTKDYYSKYYEVQEDIKGQLPGVFNTAKNLTVFYNGIRRAVNALDIPSPKIAWTASKIVENLDQNKKILVYSNWIGSGISILRDVLDQLNIPYSYVTGNMDKKSKDINVADYNSGKNKIMLISSSGSEGLNLKETRTVVLLEPYWNSTRIDQVIGRAVRYKSHANLPKKDRTVDIYNLLLSKPKEHVYKSDKIPSADNILLDMSRYKQVSIETFYKDLRQSSIEKDSGCFPKRLRNESTKKLSTKISKSSKARRALEQELLALI
jgi:SNF2 family DNA or RNA helicase